MQDTYKTIKAPTEGFFKDRLSKFYSFAFPVSNLDEVKQIRNQIRKKYYDARHHVYAYSIGINGDIFGYSDDGEPSNSSGPPVFNAIKSANVTNILIIVVRYFGGKKLGIPGLINAYRTAALNAIGNAEIITKTAEATFKVETDFSSLNKIMHLIKKLGLSIKDQVYNEKCFLTLSCPLSKLDNAKEKISNAGGKIIL